MSERSKAIILDFYGVLYADTLWGLAEKFIPHRSQEKQQQLHDITTATSKNMLDRERFWEEAARIYDQPLDLVLVERDRLGQINEALLHFIGDVRHQYPGVKTAILSNAAEGVLCQLIDKKITDKYFDLVIESGHIGTLKPEKECYQYALQSLDVHAENSLFFDDREMNVEGARAVGMHAETYVHLQGCMAAVEKFMAQFE